MTDESIERKTDRRVIQLWVERMLPELVYLRKGFIEAGRGENEAGILTAWAVAQLITNWMRPSFIGTDEEFVKSISVLLRLSQLNLENWVLE